MKRTLLPLLLALLAGGCAFPGGGDDGPVPTVTPTLPSPPPAGPPLVFGGVVVDARTGAPLADATVRLDLTFLRPCFRPGVGYASWTPAVHEDGRFGPFEVPRPRSDDVAFFLHAEAPGRSPNLTFVGPEQARGDLGNLTIRLHEEAAVEGRAPPGTVLALQTDAFPRLTTAGADGSFRFANARVVPAQLVAATDAPQRAEVTAPANVSFEASQGGWLLEGHARTPTGTPLAADVVAWNGTLLWSAARSGDNGVFAMPLPAQPVTLRLEARTEDGAHAGTLALDVQGPPAARQAVLLRPQC